MPPRDALLVLFHTLTRPTSLCSFVDQGRGSQQSGWETALVKLMQHWKSTQGQAGGGGGGDEDDDTEFGFGENAPEPEKLEDGEEWEEVDLDENGNPIESTARPVIP